MADRSLEIGLVDERELERYILGFRDSEGRPLEFRPDEATEKTRGVGARIWGVGMMTLVLECLGNKNEARQALSVAPEYILPSGGFAYAFGGDERSTRSTAHLLLGAAASEAELRK